MFLFWKSSLLHSKRNGDFKMDGGGAKVQQPNAADMLCIEFISTHAVVAPDLVVRFASSSGQHHQSIIGAVLSHRPLIIKIIYLTCSLRMPRSDVLQEPASKNSYVKPAERVSFEKPASRRRGSSLCIFRGDEEQRQPSFAEIKKLEFLEITWNATPKCHFLETFSLAHMITQLEITRIATPKCHIHETFSEFLEITRDCHPEMPQTAVHASRTHCSSSKKLEATQEAGSQLFWEAGALPNGALVVKYSYSFSGCSV